MSSPEAVARRPGRCEAPLRLSFRPPVQNVRFWAVQGLVVLLVAAYALVAELCVRAPQFHDLCVVTITLFLIPVLYAALNFGFPGAVATALWCALLAGPVVVFQHHGIERLTETLEVLIVTAVAVFVGQRVDREKSARSRAELVQGSLRVSEARYRSLFLASPIPLLMVRPDGTVVDANPAAETFFARPPAALREQPLTTLLGAVAAGVVATLGSGSGGGPAVVVERPDLPPVWVQPVVTRYADPPDNQLYLILLRDVTEERRRQQELWTYARSVLAGQEEERRRIAQELHDDTTQELILLCRQLEIIEERHAPLAPGLRQGLEDARASVEGIVESLREFIHGLRPPLLDDLGLTASIRRLLADMKQRTGTRGRLRVFGHERRLPEDVALGLFRIAQEALHNVEWHAQASYVAMCLTFAEGEARMAVQDDGVGLDAAILERPDNGGRLGLLGMRERAQLLGGTLEIRSQPGHGTRITVRIPLRAADGRESTAHEAAEQVPVACAPPAP